MAGNLRATGVQKRLSVFVGDSLPRPQSTVLNEATESIRHSYSPISEI